MFDKRSDILDKINQTNQLLNNIGDIISSDNEVSFLNNITSNQIYNNIDDYIFHCAANVILEEYKHDYNNPKSGWLNYCISKRFERIIICNVASEFINTIINYLWWEMGISAKPDELYDILTKNTSYWLYFDEYVYKINNPILNAIIQWSETNNVPQLDEYTRDDIIIFDCAYLYEAIAIILYDIQNGTLTKETNNYLKFILSHKNYVKNTNKTLNIFIAEHLMDWFKDGNEVIFMNYIMSINKVSGFIEINNNVYSIIEDLTLQYKELNLSSEYVTVLQFWDTSSKHDNSYYYNVYREGEVAEARVSSRPYQNILHYLQGLYTNTTFLQGVPIEVLDCCNYDNNILDVNISREKLIDILVDTVNTDKYYYTVEYIGRLLREGLVTDDLDVGANIDKLNILVRTYVDRNGTTSLVKEVLENIDIINNFKRNQMDLLYRLEPNFLTEAIDFFLTNSYYFETRTNYTKFLGVIIGILKSATYEQVIEDHKTCLAITTLLMYIFENIDNSHTQIVEDIEKQCNSLNWVDERVRNALVEISIQYFFKCLDENKDKQVENILYAFTGYHPKLSQWCSYRNEVKQNKQVLYELIFKDVIENKQIVNITDNRLYDEIDKWKSIPVEV